MDVAQTEFHASFFESNPSFAATSRIVEFTRPLISLGLGYFTFDRHYIDGGRIALTNNAQWIRFYWESGLYKKAIFEGAPYQFSNGHVFWSWLNREPIYSAAALHGIGHGVTLTKKRENYYDFFHFGAVNNNSINNEVIVRNIEHLHKFALLFEYKMKSLILAAEKERIFASPVDRICSLPTAGDVDLSEFERGLGNLLGKRDTSRIFLGEKFSHHYLTRCEALLIEKLVAGASCAEISERLNISNGAIDKHVKNIKEKLRCETLCHLGFVIGQLDASDIHNFSNV